MPQKLSLRWLALLTILVVAVAASSCGRGTQQPPPPPPKAHPCFGIGINHYKPRICIDDSTPPNLPATPDRALAANHQKPLNGTGSVTIEWFAPGNHGIKVTMDLAKNGKPCIVEPEPVCPGGAKCTATINPNADDKQECKYAVWVPGDNRFHKNDPVVVVENCCPDP